MAQSRRSSTCKMSIASSALVVALALAGCQASGAEDPTTPPESSPSTSALPSGSASVSATPTPTPTPKTPEPTPASSAGPAAHIPVPDKPALANKNTKAGLEAFTKWWFELFSYGYATNDWKKFESVTDRGCKTCTNVKSIVQGIYENGRWLKGGKFTVIDFDTKFELNTAGSIVSYVKNGQGPITYFKSDGTELRTDPAPDPEVDVVIAVYDDAQWIMLDYGKPQGT